MGMNKVSQGAISFSQHNLDFMIRLLPKDRFVNWSTMAIGAHQLKKDAPGFIGNRLQFALWREALNLVESGIADPRDVDTCLKYSFCPRYTSIGIFEHFDNGDLTLNMQTCNANFPTLSSVTEAPPAVTDRMARGDLGAKTGVGFYDWRDVGMEAYRKRVSAPYWHFINWDMPRSNEPWSTTTM